MWIKVKYSFDSNRLDYFCNQSVSVVTDNYRYEQVIIFGGITNKILEKEAVRIREGTKGFAETTEEEDTEQKMSSFLSNKCYMLEIKQRPKMSLK